VALDREGGNAEAPVVVAVVSWNTRDLLVRCLHSLAPDVEAGRADVWVVDNGSTDGSAEAARSAAPWATLVEPGENLGFGAAVNLVAARTPAPWLAAANADVAVEPGALENLLAAGADERVGCVAPRLILPDGGTQHSVYPFPTVPFTLAFNLGLPRVSRRLADRLCVEGAWDPERPRAVPWAIGAFLLVRHTAFDDVGGFDERQWMYAEDLDIGWRLHGRGWITRYEPRARVLHEAGAATSAAFGDDRRVPFMTATYAVLVRRRGKLRAAAVGVLNVAGAALQLALLAPRAALAGRWRWRRDEARRWLEAHRRGLRLALRGGRGPETIRPKPDAAR
jgi:N-acetylglucosaminyl-diphospho-decaprenol L-rhamnosyltransferase